MKIHQRRFLRVHENTRSPSNGMVSIHYQKSGMHRGYKQFHSVLLKNEMGEKSDDPVFRSDEIKMPLVTLHYKDLL